jgi:hypothetical protein
MYLPGLTLNLSPLISVSWVARMTGVSISARLSSVLWPSDFSSPMRLLPRLKVSLIPWWFGCLLCLLMLSFESFDN